MRKRIALAWFASVVLSPCAAQNIDVIEITGQPLMYMREGNVSGCGIRAFAIVSGTPDELRGSISP